MAEHDELLAAFQHFAQTSSTTICVMEYIAPCPHEKKARYNWVGFYFSARLDPNV